MEYYFLSRLIEWERCQSIEQRTKKWLSYYISSYQHQTAHSKNYISRLSDIIITKVLYKTLTFQKFLKHQILFVSMGHLWQIWKRISSSLSKSYLEYLIKSSIAWSQRISTLLYAVNNVNSNKVLISIEPHRCFPLTHLISQSE